MKFTDKVMEMLGEGLSNAGPQISAELSRLGTQGTMELASGMFNGNGFVPYGPGQYTPSIEPAAPEKTEPAQEVEHEQGRGM